MGSMRGKPISSCERAYLRPEVGPHAASGFGRSESSIIVEEFGSDALLHTRAGWQGRTGLAAVAGAGIISTSGGISAGRRIWATA